MKSFRRKPADRAGYTLALFAMFFFGMMGLAGLVIDIAFVRSAQRHMQTAVDSAALEGLRLGRQPASDMVANVFDDDFNPQDGDPNNYGAGPEVNYAGGVDPGPTPPYFAETLSVPSPPVYKPTLELNAGDAPSGDMAAGTYNPGQSSTRPTTTRAATSPMDRAGATPSSCGCGERATRKGWTKWRASVRAVRRFRGCSAAAR